VAIDEGRYSGVHQINGYSGQEEKNSLRHFLTRGRGLIQIVAVENLAAAGFRA
jgi:hypothetical protein